MDGGFIGAGMVSVSDTDGRQEVSPGGNIEAQIEPGNAGKIPRNIRFPDQSAQGRSLRWKRQQAELQAALSIVIRSQVTIVNCGSDTQLEHKAKLLGFGRFDLVAVRLLFGNHVFSVICAPTRIWKKRTQFRKLLLLKAEAARGGRRVILVPSSSIQSGCRFDNASALAGSRTLKPSKSERQKVIDHITMHKSSSVQVCAKLLGHHKDPMGVILNLVVHRWLQLSPGPLGPDSLLSAVG